MFWLKLNDLLKRIGWLLGIYYALRLAFLLLNYRQFQEAGFGQLTGAFLIGLRFDLAAIFMVNALFVVLSLAPFYFSESKGYQGFLKFLFIAGNLPFLCLNLIDLEYFKFIGRRTSNELFTITHDIQDQTAQLVQHYWYFPLAGLLLLLFMIKFYPKPVPKTNAIFYGQVQFFGFILMIGLTVLLIRGGWQLKPIRPANAFGQQPPVLGHLSLNSTFTFIKSISQPVLEPLNYFEDRAELVKALDFDPEKYQRAVSKPFKENVVLIILESFAAEYTGIANGAPRFTPFFDSLATQGAYFQNNYANGRKSIEALPSLLAGLPSLLPEPYISSTFQSNTLYGIGTIAKANGYHTSFFHGATNGTMGFNAFSRIAGFDKYYGLNEYPGDLRKQDYDGTWGILDEPYLQYFARQLTTQAQPFLSAVFTLSSHQPYPVPEKYKDRFPKGNLPIHASIGYTDFALKRFFEEAAKQPWYKNTLFIITADHTQESSDPAYQNDLGKFKTPLLLFHPGKKLGKFQEDRITQQADIPATIANYLQFPTNKLLPFSRSVLDTTQTGRAIFFSDEHYFLVHQDLVTRLNSQNEVQFFQYQPLGLAPLVNAQPAKQERYQQELKALLQFYQNGLIKNDLYFWLKR